jgi:hypothetical protein
MLYFYPPEVPLNEKLYYIGLIHAVINFGFNFEPKNETVTMMRFSNSKTAIIKRNDMFFVNHFNFK